MAKVSVTVLLDQYGGRKTAVFLEGEEYEKMGLVSSEVKAEWKTLQHYLAKKKHRKTWHLNYMSL